MKVLHLINTFLTPTMTFIYNEISALKEEIDIVVVCHKRLNEEKFPFETIRIIQHSNIDRTANFLNKKIHRTDRNYWFRAARSLKRIIEEEQPDLIHCQFGNSFVFLKDQLPNIDIPIVVSFHGFDASSALERPAYVRQLNRYFDERVFPIFVSHDMRRTFQAKGIQFQNETILYYGTNVEAFQRTNYKLAEPFSFLQISSLTEKKGHTYTLKAFAQLLKTIEPPYPQLLIGGDGPFREAIEREIEELGIGEHVHLLGLMDNEQVKQAMENASCFVHHSITSKVGSKEGIPNVIMEAMAMELPILSTYHAGIPELVENGTHGYLFEEKDVKTCAQRMKEIMSWSYKKENREKVVKSFERKRRTSKLIAHYQKAIS